MSSFAETWRQWDRWSADPVRANTLEDQAQHFAARLHITGSQLRDRMSALRRDGYSHLEAVQLFEQEMAA